MIKILLIDDEQVLRDGITKLLMLEGFEVVCASTGKEGLEIFEHSKAQIVLCDIKMPGMDGIEVLRKIKEISSLTEVILLTGHAGIENAIEALKSGAFGYLLKPVEYDELLSEINRAISKIKIIEDLTKTNESLGLNAELKDAELEHAYRELREKSAAMMHIEKLSSLGELIAGVAHEMKQPLNCIKIINQSLLKDMEKGRFDETFAKEELEEGIKQVSKMSELIDHLRAFARKDSEKELRSICLNEITIRSLKLMEQNMIQCKITTKLELEPKGVSIFGHASQIEQVLINLINNACHAMLDAGTKDATLKIRTWATDLAVGVDVTDNGPGIPEAIRTKIFHSFFTTKKEGEGTGLGLSISKEIVANHKGQFQLLDAQEGEGATFRMSFPLSSGSQS